MAVTPSRYHPPSDWLSLNPEFMAATSDPHIAAGTDPSLGQLPGGWLVPA